MRGLRGTSGFVATTFGFLLGACAHDAGRESSTTAPPVITYTAQDYSFEGPDTIPGGLATIRLVNRGQDVHHIQLLKLEGRSVDDFPKDFPGSTSFLPKWIKHMGGANGIVAGEEASATLSLEPGTYVLLCEIPDRQMRSHVALGMVKAVTVKSSSNVRSTPSKPDTEVKLLDFAFVPSHPLTPGRHTVKVRNEGDQPHELVLVELPPGASAKDFTDAFMPGASGPPKGKPIGGMNALEKGGEGTFPVELSPGNYALICFKFDPASKAPHFAKGMITDLSVR